MQQLSGFLRQRKAAGATIFPPGPQIFAAFDATPFDAVKVVILGQDPYHGAGQAHGLCFSVLPGVPVPPSLLNIYKELAARPAASSAPTTAACCRGRAQGVLLLNAVLTVEAGKPVRTRARAGKASPTMSSTPSTANARAWCSCSGAATRRPKGKVIDPRRHRVLKAPHPSPLSAHRGFLGCGHFSAANQFLRRTGQRHDCVGAAARQSSLAGLDAEHDCPACTG